MKKTILLTAWCLIFSFTHATPITYYESKPNPQRILLVSFISQNFYSTYENAEIAKTNEISEAEVLKILDEKIAGVFEDSQEDGVEFVNFDTGTAPILEKVAFSYNNEKECLTPYLGDFTKDEFNTFMEENNVAYVIFLNTYQMKWIGDPQYKLDNEIHYSIFEKDKKSIVEGKYTFSTPKLIPVVKMEKKYKKAVTKICNAFLKNS